MDSRYSYDRTLYASEANTIDIAIAGEAPISQGLRMPQVWQSGFHRVRCESGELREIRIYPVDSGFGKPRWQAGRPMLAEGDVAREILERYQRLSKPFGTDVKIDGNMGLIRL